MKKVLKDWGVELTILLIATALAFLNPRKISLSLLSALKSYLKLSPIILGVSLLSSFISVAVSKQKVEKIVGKKSGIKGILIGAIFGTLMVGASYMFYEFFNELRKKGASVKVIASTIGAWAIKIPWLPFAIAILGLRFTVLFSTFILIFAILSGFFVEDFSGGNSGSGFLSFFVI